MAKIVTILNLNIPPRELKSKDPRHLLTLIFSQWLSLSTCTIQAVIDIVPPPSVAQKTRIPRMLYPDLNAPTVEPKNKLERDLFNCDSSPEAFVVAYVSKMFAVAREDLPENKRRPFTAQEMREHGREKKEKGENIMASPEGQEQTETIELSQSLDEVHTVVLGFARLYSGLLHKGSSIYCLLPKYNVALGPTDPRNSSYIIKATVDDLYIMMGRELEPVDTVKAGNVFALRGLSGKVWKNATLCAQKANADFSNHITEDRDCFVNLGGVIRQVSSSLYECFRNFLKNMSYCRTHRLFAWL